MDGLLFALLSVLTAAVLRVTLKRCAIASDRVWATLILYHIGGFLVLLAFLGVPDLAQLSTTEISLLLTTGALFSIAGLLNIVAMKEIDASAGEVFHSLTFIVSVVAGFMVFHEDCSLVKLVGTSIILVGILHEARHAAISASRGLVYKVGSSVLIAVAMMMTKYLTISTPSAVIMLSGFIVPGAVYVGFGWRDIREIPATIRASKGLILTIPFLDAMTYGFGIKALALGGLSSTYIAFQMTIAVVFALEVLMHGWRKEVYAARIVSAACCMCGAVIALGS